MKTATTIAFTVQLYTLRSWTILRLPEAASEQLPSRGQVAVTGLINGYDFTAVLEPDGYWGHWLRVSDELQLAVGVRSGDTVKLTLTPTKNWPEPVVPKDVEVALKTTMRSVRDKWLDITPMARWEWIRWVNSTANTDTRAIRIEKMISKLAGTHRRPCCFNLAACTEPYLAKGGRLIESEAVIDE